MLKKILIMLMCLLNVAVIASAKAPITNAKVQVNGIEINYNTQGAGYPIILIHGGGLENSMWENLANTLDNRYKVYRLDNRGHGLTTNPKQEYSYKLLADDVVAFAKVLKIEKPLIMGYSDGGMICMMIGMNHPEFAKAIIIGGASPSLGDDHYMQGMLDGFGSNKAGKITLSELDQALKNQTWIEPFMSERHHPSETGYWKTMLLSVWEMWTTPLNLTNNDLKKIIAPTLVLCGDKDEYFTVKSAVELYDNLPNAELAIIPNGVHSLVRLRSEIFFALINDFLDRQFIETKSKLASNAVAE